MSEPAGPVSLRGQVSHRTHHRGVWGGAGFTPQTARPGRSGAVRSGSFLH